MEDFDKILGSLRDYMKSICINYPEEYVHNAISQKLMHGRTCHPCGVRMWEVQNLRGEVSRV